MPGSRVNPGKKKSAKLKQSSFAAKNISNHLIRFIFLTLSEIGWPFYLLLSYIVKTTYSAIWSIGNPIFNIFYKVKSKKEKVKVKKDLVKFPKTPEFSFTISSPNFSNFLKKELKNLYLLFSYIKNFKLPSFSVKSKTLVKSKKVVKKTSFKIPQIPKIVFPQIFPKVKKRYKLTFLMTLFVLTSFASFWFFLLKNLPKPGTLATRDQVVSTKIYDRDGNLLYKVYNNENRTIVHLSDLPQSVKEATIAIEDADFYSHPGFSLRGITRAFYKNVTYGERTGGSTITQQLVKNTLLSPEKTLLRKIKEVILAMQVELTFSKDQILEMYLNEVSYGGAAYGIEEASNLYFGKRARELTLAEAALLSGLPKAPTTYSPFGANPQLAKARQIEVLSKMLEEKHITPEEADQAIREPLTYRDQRQDIKSPHFVMYIKQLLAETYGENVVEEGGLEVITSLDSNIQNMAEQVVLDETQKIERLRISNGAALVTNPQNGEILAMVGSKDYFDPKGDGNYNVTTALRQPGSSIKPVTYSYGLESKMFTASSIIPDTPITYHVAGSEPYTPRNYDNSFHGNVTLRTALGSSFNIPAVKVLASIGMNNMLNHASKLGITTWKDPTRYGLSLTLGGGEVKMTDMNVVYGTFANYGKKSNLRPILRVTDYKGNVISENPCTDGQYVKEDNSSTFITKILKNLSPNIANASEVTNGNCTSQALNPSVAFIITDILKDNAARTPTFGPNSLLVIPNHKEVAVKTGTTQNLRDNWTIGYNQNYVVSTWVGNNDNTPMSYVASGITGASPIWHKIMRNLLDGQPNHDWVEPQEIVKTTICPRTGTLPCSGCGGKVEYFVLGTEPTRQCVPKPPEETPPPGEPQGQIL